MELPDLRRVPVMPPVLRRFMRRGDLWLIALLPTGAPDVLAAEDAKASILDNELAMLCRLRSLVIDFAILTSVYVSNL